MGRHTYTLEELSDIEDVKALKYAYLRCLDQKLWGELATLFVPDATAAYSGGRYSYTGSGEIVAFLERNMGREGFHSSHRAHHPEISLEGDRAEVTWAMEDLVVDSDLGFVLMGAAFYEEVCVRVGGQWRFEHMGYRRSFEFMYPTSSVEGFALTASWWGTGGSSTLPVA